MMRARGLRLRGVMALGVMACGLLLAAVPALAAAPEAPVTEEKFLADVEQFAAAPEWVTEWRYGQARPVLHSRPCGGPAAS